MRIILYHSLLVILSGIPLENNVYDGERKDIEIRA